MKCNCIRNNLDDAVWDACKHALFAMATNAIAPIVVRNGGWEQTFRNFLALALEKSVPDSFALTEASFIEDEAEAKNPPKSRRADIELGCLTCTEAKTGRPGKIVAVEIKVNFSNQGGRNGFIGRRAHAKEQLKNYVKEEIHAWYVRVIIDLQADSSSATVRAHNNSSIPSYKKFGQSAHANYKAALIDRTLRKTEQRIDTCGAVSTVTVQGCRVLSDDLALIPTACSTKSGASTGSTKQVAKRRVAGTDAAAKQPKRHSRPN